MHISSGRNFRDTVPVGREMSFEQFVKLVSSLPIHTGHLHWTQYCAADKAARARAKDSAWFIPALFVRPERRADCVELLSGFVCDFDDGAIGRPEIAAALVEVRSKLRYLHANFSPGPPSPTDSVGYLNGVALYPMSVLYPLIDT